MRQHDSNRRHYGAGGSMQTRCNVFILARRAQSGEGSLPRLWYLNFNADLYFSIYIYIYFSLSLSLVLETLANNRRISLVCVSRCLLLGEDIDPPSSVFVILCRYTYKCRNHDRLDWSNLQDWIFENWIRLLSIDWNDQNWVLEFWKESEELRVVDGLDWKN